MRIRPFVSGSIAMAVALGACASVPQRAVGPDPGVQIVDPARVGFRDDPAGRGTGSAADPASSLANRSESAGKPAEPVPGELIVSLDPGATPPTDLGALGTATVKSQVAFGNPVVLLGLPGGVSLEAAAAALAGRPGIRAISPNRRFKPHAVEPPTDDPYLPMQWPYGPDMADVYGGWEVLDTLDQDKIDSTTVAVVDTGTDPGHPDLNVLTGYDTYRYQGGTSVPEGGYNAAGISHGTLVAGVVGARKGNGQGAAGVAPGVKILPIMVFDSYGYSSEFAILLAFKVAAEFNRESEDFDNLSDPSAGPVRVLNASLGGFGPRTKIWDDAVDYLAQRGIVAIISAGNGGGDGLVESPANSQGAVAVSCTMLYGIWEVLASYSSYGREVWVSAPGNYIWSTLPGQGAGSSPSPSSPPVIVTEDHGGPPSLPAYPDAYSLFNGTSSAAPFAAGVAALINIAFGGAAGLPDQDSREWTEFVKERLKSTADDLGPIGWDPLYGWGRVNARKAISGTP